MPCPVTLMVSLEASVFFPVVLDGEERNQPLGELVDILKARQIGKD